MYNKGYFVSLSTGQFKMKSNLPIQDIEFRIYNSMKNEVDVNHEKAKFIYFPHEIKLQLCKTVRY